MISYRHFSPFAKSTYRDSQVVTSRELGDLSQIPKASTHNDSLVVVFLVVVEDRLYALDTWVLLGIVIPLICGLVPIQDASDKGRDEESTRFSCSNGLREGEHEGKIAIDAMLRL